MPDSIWKDAEIPDEQRLTEDLSAEVCVVGGGIAGLTTAYRLARAGVDVVLLEARSLGDGETGLTSAHLASALDDRFTRLEEFHGPAGAKLAAESHAAAIDTIEETVHGLAIPCDFARVDGFLFRAEGQEADLEEECAAARRCGLAAEMVEDAGTPLLRTGRCLRFGSQAQFHPLRYLAGLAEGARRAGLRMFSHARVVDVTGGRSAAVTTADGRKVAAKHLVVATNVPINDRVRVHTWLEPQRSYVIALSIPHQQVPQQLFWDCAEPYHYVRIVPGAREDLVLIGGEDHPTGSGPSDPLEPYVRLESWARRTLTAATLGAVVKRWSGQIIEPLDGLALIGRNPGDADNVYIITGDSGNGLTHGTIGGMIVSDLIQGVANPWEHLYRPSRMTMAAMGSMTRHAAQMVGSYGDWISGGDITALGQLPPGGAGLLRQGLTKVAAYRDLRGHLHTCSAVCPHLGGLVRWNPSESTWDCPCHGSRFAVDGTVINGPAMVPLQRVDMAATGGGSGQAVAAG